jgi:LysM repeat protein
VRPYIASSSYITVAHRQHRYWIVQPGQTLGEISGRTGVTVSQIQALNPGRALEHLPVGAPIRIRP